MALIRVNPTRMELTRLKKRLVIARRGHKLLKDKMDELMKQFLDIVRENRQLRKSVEDALKDVYDNFLIASAIMSKQSLEQALMFPKQQIQLDVKFKNIMSVNVPVFIWEDEQKEDIYPYGFFGTSIELDRSVSALKTMLPSLLNLAQMEKSMQLLAAEIEKTRRRVNALEYVMIPQLEETIKYISMKLEENERGNLTRLMKVKDMMIKEVLEARQY